MSENMVKVRRNTYLVRTQAGFRKALKEYKRYYEIAANKQVNGFPKSYPSLVILGTQYTGGDFCLFCQVFHLNELKDLIALETAHQEERAKQKEGNAT